MKNTICEKLMWYAMTPTIFNFIANHIDSVDVKQIKVKTKKNYVDMIKRTPDIGSVFKNQLRVSLSGGIVWLSVYDALEGKMDKELFGEMVTVTMHAPLIKKAFSGKNPFRTEYQQKKIQKDKIANAISNSEFNWITEMIPGRDENEYTTIYHQCGLCALGRQEHKDDLIPYMCAMDFISIDMMGGVLHRTGTISNGAKVCDFHVVKKNSKWDVKENTRE